MPRKPKHEDEFGSRGVEFAMANWDMQRTQSYVERGRQFENATDEDLQALFVQAFRDWRANLWEDGRRSRVADVSAESPNTRSASSTLRMHWSRMTSLKL